MCLDLAGNGDPDQLGLIIQATREGLCPVNVLGQHAGGDKRAAHAIVDEEEVLVLMEDGMACSREAQLAAVTTKF